MIAKELVTLLRFKLEKSGIMQYRAQVQKVKQDVKKVAHSLAYDVGAGARKVGQELGLVNRHQAMMVRNARRTVGEYSKLGALVKAAFFGAGAKGAFGMADSHASVEGRVSLVVDESEKDKVLEDLFNNAQKSRSSYTATADLFQTIARNKGELGMSTDQSLQLTDIVGKAMKIGGGTAAAQQGALTQLSQALGSGVLRGQELNSILEQAPRLAHAIADSFGVPVGKLKELGEQGKLSSKELANGLIKQAEKINDEFSKIPIQFSDSWTMASNSMGRAFNELNKATGLSNALFEVTKLVSENMKQILKTLIFIGLTMGIYKLNAYLILARANTGGLIASMIKATRVAIGLDTAMSMKRGPKGAVMMLSTLKQTLLPMLRMAMILYGVYLIGQDIYVWMKGGKSVLGEWIGPVENFKDQLKWVKDKLNQVKNFAGGAGMRFSEWATKLAINASIVAVIIKALGIVLAVVKAVLAVLGAAAASWLILIIAIAAAVWQIWKNWDVITAYMSAAWDKLKTHISTKAKEAWDSVKSTAKDAWDSIITSFSDAWSSAIAKVKGWMSGLFAPVQWLIDKFGSAGAMTINHVGGGMNGLRDVNKNAISSISTSNMRQSFQFNYNGDLITKATDPNRAVQSIPGVKDILRQGAFNLRGPEATR